MAKYLLPYFGALDTGHLEEYYDVAVQVNGDTISADLNFMSRAMDLEVFGLLESFIHKLPEYDKANRKRIEHDYFDKNETAVKDYVRHHLEEIPAGQLATIIDYGNEAVSRERQMINALKLVRVGLYPYDEEEFAMFDYSIGRDISQYLVVVCTDMVGKLVRIGMES